MFASVQDKANQPVTLIAFIFLVAMGNTLYPVCLRLLFNLELLAIKAVNRFRQVAVPHDLTTFPSNASSTNASFHAFGAANSDLGIRTEEGLKAILHSQTPCNCHYFLFVPSETLYLFLAWLFIAGIQAVPLLGEQWSGDGVLAPFSPPMRVLVAICQSVVTRFAGTMLIDYTMLSQGYLVIMMLVLYLLPHCLSRQIAPVASGTR